MNKLLMVSIATAVLSAMFLPGAPVGVSRAQEEPVLILNPSSGPCDGTIQVSGSGYEPGVVIDVKLGAENLAVTEVLATPTTDLDGEFSLEIPLGATGCERKSARETDSDDDSATIRSLMFYAASRSSGVGRLALYKRTTLFATQELTFIVSPASGPCDATLRATGSGFAADSQIRITLSRPHAEGSVVNLTSTVTDSGGAFSAPITLGEFGCVVARLHAELADPGQPKEIGISASTDSPGGGSRVVRYGYTTTAVAGDVDSVPTESTIETMQPSETPSPSTNQSGDSDGIEWAAVAIPMATALAGATLAALFMSRKRGP